MPDDERNIFDDFDKAEERDDGNPYFLLLDDFGWTLDEIVAKFDLLDPYSGAEASNDRNGIEFLKAHDFDIGVNFDADDE